MRLQSGCRRVQILGFAMCVAACAAGSRAEAQITGYGWFQQPPALFMSGVGPPRIPPRGDWSQVVTVTPKWLVLQNESGQQFPVSFDNVQMFYLRWPTNMSEVSRTALLETTGIRVSSSEVRTDHIDVFDGAERALVVPGVEILTGFNRVVIPYFYPLVTATFSETVAYLPGENEVPDQLHVAGPLVDVNPIVLGVGPSGGFAVYPSIGGISLTQVTVGSPSYVRPGDLAYSVSQSANAKGVSLSELIVYKNTSVRGFQP